MVAAPSAAAIRAIARGAAGACAGTTAWTLGVRQVEAATERVAELVLQPDRRVAEDRAAGAEDEGAAGKCHAATPLWRARRIFAASTIARSLSLIHI